MAEYKIHEAGTTTFGREYRFPNIALDGSLQRLAVSPLNLSCKVSVSFSEKTIDGRRQQTSAIVLLAPNMYEKDFVKAADQEVRMDLPKGIKGDDQSKDTCFIEGLEHDFIFSRRVDAVILDVVKKGELSLDLRVRLPFTTREYSSVFDIPSTTLTTFETES